jgi:uncharacterized membrane protein
MRKNSIFHKLKEQFVVGLVVILPLFLTIYIIWFLFSKIDSILGKYLTQLTGIYIYGLGFILLVLLIWLVGFVSQNYIGKSILRHIKVLIFKTPLFGNVFKGIETISSKVIAKGKGSFEHVVVVEYPKKDIYALGFMTSVDSVKFAKAKSPIDFVPVFIPTTPNPTSGYLYFIEKKNIYPIEMSVEEAMETIISLGFVHPDKYKPKKINH